MQTEIEAKFLNVNHDDIRLKLKKNGAKCTQPKRLMRRKNYDYPDKRLDKVNGWIRVRDEGEMVTLSYKQLNERTLHGTKEISIVVDSFDSTCDFLESIGLVLQSYQETKRESWIMNDVEIELDEWPWIKPFIEIESKSEKELIQVVQKLELNLHEAVYGSVEIAYQSEYDVTEEEVCQYKEILFTDVPSWLNERRL